LTGRIATQEAREAQDINQVNGRITAVENRADNLQAGLAGVSQALAATDQQVAAIGASLSDTIFRVDKLESVNKIWRANFQVVNKTFAELRKKIQFVVPILRLPVFVGTSKG
jgi:septal ring factor EnvC (AmiA/AmiB activator)